MDRGGAETRTMEIMRRLDPQRLAFDFLVLSGRPGAYAAEIERLGGRVLPCAVPAGLAALPALMRRGGWPVVHSHVQHFSGAVLAAARAAGVERRLAHIRTADAEPNASRRRRLYRGTMRRLVDATATTVIAVSQAAMTAFYGPGWRTDARRVVLYNGVDDVRFRAPVDRAAVRAALNVPDDAALLVHVGNFHPAKNHAALVELATRLSKRAVPFVLALAGDGPGRSAIAKLFTERGLDANVRLLGARDDIPELLGAADCFVFPSHWEGLPGALLEALAAGVPVVASRIAPVEEIARQATGVECIAPGDGEAFARAVVRRLDHPIRAVLPAQFTTAAAMDGLLRCYA